MKWRTSPHGKLTIAVFLLWQVLVVLHIASTAHSYCHEHRAIEHVTCGTKDDEHRGNVHHHGWEECVVLATLASSHHIPLAAPTVVYAPDSIHACVDIAAPTNTTLSQRYRYHLAPSLSPPQLPRLT